MKKFVIPFMLALCLQSIPFAQAQDYARIVSDVRRGADMTSEAKMLVVLVKIACAVQAAEQLPAGQAIGLHEKTSGENITFYAAAQKSVGVSRLMYPDGRLRKVFTDAGPAGSNGPTWAEEGNIETKRYVPVVCEGAPPVVIGGGTQPAPVDLSPVLAKVNELTAQVQALQADNVDLRRQLAAVNESISGALDSAAAAVNMSIDLKNYIKQHPIPDGCKVSYLGCKPTFNYPPVQ